jgi:hypothetical protein
MGGLAATPKTAGMHCSRKAHYFLFVLAMKLDDDLLMKNTPLEWCNYQMAFHAPSYRFKPMIPHKADF